MKTKLLSALSAALVTLGLTAWLVQAQNGGGPEGGGGRPGGSAFSTQFNAGSSFGGTGPGTSGFVLTSRGAGLSPTFQASGGPTPAALTKADDTNVTLTLGGTPATALLQATSITAGWTGRLAFSRFTQGSALSVLANATNGTADFASLAAGSDFQILRRTGTALAFGSIDLSQSGAVGSSILPVANGGLNLSAATDDNVPVGNGTTWQSKALTSCSAATSAVTYNTTTNAFGCNTITAGTAQTTGTFTITWDDMCTTSPTTSASYSVTGVVVTVIFGPLSSTSCTSDSTNTRATSTSTLPVAIRPTTSQYIYGIYTKDNGTNSTGCIGFASNGIVDAVPNGTTGCPGPNWTNTGVKSIGLDKTVTLVYQLN